MVSNPGVDVSRRCAVKFLTREFTWILKQVPRQTHRQCGHWRCLLICAPAFASLFFFLSPQALSFKQLDDEEGMDVVSLCAALSSIDMLWIEVRNRSKSRADDGDDDDEKVEELALPFLVVWPVLLFSSPIFLPFSLCVSASFLRFFFRFV